MENYVLLKSDCPVSGRFLSYYEYVSWRFFTNRCFLPPALARSENGCRR